MLETREDRRRRACEGCGGRFTTVELLLDDLPDDLSALKQTKKVAPKPVQKKVDRAAKTEARRRIEEMREKRAAAYNPFDEDTDFIPDRW